MPSSEEPTSEQGAAGHAQEIGGDPSYAQHPDDQSAGDGREKRPQDLGGRHVSDLSQPLEDGDLATRSVLKQHGERDDGHIAATTGAKSATRKLFVWGTSLILPIWRVDIWARALRAREVSVICVVVRVQTM